MGGSVDAALWEKLLEERGGQDAPTGGTEADPQRMRKGREGGTACPHRTEADSREGAVPEGPVL